MSHRGIEANPTKIQAIVDMSPPQSARDVQRLTGRLAALNRFISRSAERSLPFLKTLRGAKDFAWGPEQAAAFASLKQYLAELAILTSPDSSLPLLLYVAASPHAVSAELVQEQTVTISEDLTSHEEEKLLCCLSKNKDVFAWSALDLSRTCETHDSA